MNIKFFTDAKKFDVTGNKNVAESMARWVFKENGVIRVSSVSHRKVGQIKPPASYTIMEDVVYTINIEKLSGDKCVPYEANDVQLELVRIDPFIRITLTQLERTL